MDGQMVDGRPIVVRLRSDRNQPRPQHAGGDLHRLGPGDADEGKLYVAGLTQTVQEHVVRDLFGK
jgi:hypothetical protein